MYCKKCGKEIDYEAEVCNECVAAEQANAEAVVVEEVASAEGVVAVAGTASGKNPKMIGFGKALTSLLLPIIGAILIGIVSGLLTFAAQEAYQTLERFINNPDMVTEAMLNRFIENDLSKIGIFLVLLIGAGIVAFVMGIVGIIFGAQAISCFKKESRNGNKPIPTLIIGILGLVESVGIVLGILSAVASVALAVFYILTNVMPAI